MGERTDEQEIADLLDEDSSGGSGDVDLSDLESDAAGGGDVGFDESELGVDVDALTGDPSASSGRTRDDDETTTDSGPGFLSRLRPGVGIGLGGGDLTEGLTARSFGLSLVVTLVSMFAASSVVPLPGANLLGVFAGAFALGLASGRRRYLFLLVSGALAAGVSTLLSSAVLAFLAGLAGPLAVFGAGAGALAAALGHYFGRDLRSGLTRDV